MRGIALFFLSSLVSLILLAGCITTARTVVVELPPYPKAPAPEPIPAPQPIPNATLQSHSGTDPALEPTELEPREGLPAPPP